MIFMFSPPVMFTPYKSVENKRPVGTRSDPLPKMKVAKELFWTKYELDQSSISCGVNPHLSETKRTGGVHSIIIECEEA